VLGGALKSTQSNPITVLGEWLFGVRFW